MSDEKRKVDSKAVLGSSDSVKEAAFNMLDVLQFYWFPAFAAGTTGESKVKAQIVEPILKAQITDLYRSVAFHRGDEEIAVDDQLALLRRYVTVPDQFAGGGNGTVHQRFYPLYRAMHRVAACGHLTWPPELLFTF